VDVRTAEEMLKATVEEASRADALIMAAAVADFRVSDPRPHKIKRQAGGVNIHLQPTADILGEVANLKAVKGFPRVTVGFAAESRDIIENARTKLKSKKLDLIVANDISAADAGFSVDTNRVTLLYSDGHSEELPLMSKTEVAEIVMDRVWEMLNVKN
jgi:phosphopantothenoylcysteine decarboxylase/phosphopantothenate--cysteine ligase